MCDLFELVLLDLAGPWTSTLFFSVDWRFLAASTIIMIIILKVWNGPQVRLCFTYASWILSFFSGFSFLSRALFGTSARGQSLYLHLHCHRSSVRHDVVWRNLFFQVGVRVYFQLPWLLFFLYLRRWHVPCRRPGRLVGCSVLATQHVTIWSCAVAKAIRNILFANVAIPEMATVSECTQI